MDCELGVFRKTSQSGKLKGRSGQGTFEYALTLFALMSIVVALAAWWHYVADGAYMNRIVLSLSHALPWGLWDILGY